MMRTLVLNAGYEPLSVVSFKRALVLVINGKASVLSADDEAPVHSATAEWPRPTVIILRDYVRVPHGRLAPVTRRGVLRRDRSQCGYCLGHATTIDHVIPRSRGGRDSWENLVACCQPCNNRKGDRTPAEMGWDLAWPLRAPRDRGWTVRGTELADDTWTPWLQAAA